MTWHWLRHDWVKWETYEQKYCVADVRFPGVTATRTRIRQKRTCPTCGKLQDMVVAEMYD